MKAHHPDILERRSIVGGLATKQSKYSDRVSDSHSRVFFASGPLAIAEFSGQPARYYMN